jgi:hypothetical protein
MTEKQIGKILKEIEKFFQMGVNEKQAPATVEVFHKIETLHPSAVKYFMDGDDIVSIAFAVPTSKDLAEKFLSDKITERELFALSGPMERYGALYFYIAFTLRPYRGRGLTAQMFAASVREIPHTDDVIFLSWPSTDAGNKVLDTVERELNIIIRRKPR